MAYAPTVQAEAGFPANSVRHYGEVLGELRTDNLSHADVATAATLEAVNERAHVRSERRRSRRRAGDPRRNRLLVLHRTGRGAIHGGDEPGRFLHLPVISAG